MRLCARFICGVVDHRGARPGGAPQLTREPLDGNPNSVNCSLLETLFVLAVLSVIAGHAFGITAWLRRLPRYSRWEWSWTPLYVLSRYYQSPPPRLRFVALAFLATALVCLIILVVSAAAALRAGASGLCGFSF